MCRETDCPPTRMRQKLIWHWLIVRSVSVYQSGFNLKTPHPCSAWLPAFSEPRLLVHGGCQSSCPHSLCTDPLTHRGQYDPQSRSAFLSLPDCVNRLSARFRFPQCTPHLRLVEVMPKAIVYERRKVLSYGEEGGCPCLSHVRVKLSGQVSARLQSKALKHHLICVFLIVCVLQCVHQWEPCVLSSLCYPPLKHQSDWNVNWKCHKAHIVSQTLSYEEIITGSFIRDMTALVFSDFPPGGMIP